VSIYDDFWSWVDKSGGPDQLKWEPSEPCYGDGTPCWIWLGYTLYGYGRLKDNNRNGLLAHRYAWELENGQTIPPDICVLHWCDHRACVNPDHLYLGTKKDMVSKAHARGHQPWKVHPERTARGSRKANTKLTEEDVREIRCLRRDGMPQIELVRMFNVSRSAISDICNERTWRHVGDSFR
jgi:hypothetical protein